MDSGAGFPTASAQQLEEKPRWSESGGAKIGTAIFAKGWTVEAPVHRQE
jgi:hypothetical protein